MLKTLDHELRCKGERPIFCLHEFIFGFCPQKDNDGKFKCNHVHAGFDHKGNTVTKFKQRYPKHIFKKVCFNYINGNECNPKTCRHFHLGMVTERPVPQGDVDPRMVEGFQETYGSKRWMKKVVATKPDASTPKGKQPRSSNMFDILGDL